jgi:PAS domain S-box-containing protein
MKSTIRILHVDDDPDFAETAAALVEQIDDRFDVETATSVGEGLDRLTDADFDCVVSDYDMPGQNGIEFLETVRADNPDLPFILYTGKGSEEVASDAISAGVTDYLQKGSGISQYEVLAHRINNTVEQYRAGRVVAETERKLSQLAERTEEILFMFDSDWSELLFVNSAYEDVWNGSIDRLEANPKSFLGNVHPDDQELVEQTLERILEGNPTEVEHRIEDEDGVRWIYSKANPVFDEDGEFTRIVGFVRDITERKEREQELERKSEQFQYVEDVADIGYWEIDTQTPEPHDATLSEGVYHVHGLSPDEPFDVEKGIQFYHPEDRQQVREAVERAISAGEPYEFEARLVTDAGKERWVHSIGEPVERDGEVVTVRGVFQDITERKREEQELARQNERLAEFASIVSHDLRNPLTVAQGRLKLAREECDSERLDGVGDALERSHALIDDLLTLAREGSEVSTVDAVELGAFAEDCWHYVDTAEATLSAEAERTILTDRSRLQQLLENLYTNAIEHAGDDVGVTVGDLSDGFYIEDDGPGIPADEREEVFDAGYSTTEEGTGFGLSIVKQIVDAHGWEVRVADGSGGGARFEVTGVEFET